MRKAINQLGGDLIEGLFIVKTAKLKAFSKGSKESQDDLFEAWDIYKKIVERGDCTDLSKLEINGKDLIALGYKPGKSLGSTLEYLLDQALKDPSLNQKTF